MTPARFISTLFSWTGAAIISLVLIAAFIVMAVQGIWLFNRSNANNENRVIQNGNSYQETMRTEITHKIGDVQDMTVKIADPAYAASKDALIQSRSYAASIVCGDAAQITGVALRPAQDSWVRLNCENGSVSPSSIYYIQS